MAIDCLIRVSFQSDANANQGVNEALVGDKQAAVGSGPFQRVNTAVYRAVAGVDADVIAALNDFVAQLTNHSGVIDFVGMSLTRRRTIFDIEIDAELRDEMVRGLIDLARVELEIATAVDGKKDIASQNFNVTVGPFELCCTQYGSKQGRSYHVTRA